LDSSIPDTDTNEAAINAQEMILQSQTAASFLKALSHEGRLMILCYLSSGEKSVGQLEELLSSRQAAVSQQLSRLRSEGMVDSRREGKTVYYTLADHKTRQMIDTVYNLFCSYAPKEKK